MPTVERNGKLNADLLDTLTLVLRNAKDSPEGWSIQGLGMLRMYLTEDRVMRLHVWDKDAVYKPRLSAIHTHPWGFKSVTLAGMLTNYLYRESKNGWGTHDYISQELIWGPGGCQIGEPEETSLVEAAVRTLYPGDSYEMDATEIHETRFQDGSVSIIERTFLEDTERARVFWPAGEKWISAEPRPATRDEVARAAEKALKTLEIG